MSTTTALESRSATGPAAAGLAVPALTVPELIAARAEDQAGAGRVALCVDGSRELTFGAWFDRSRAVARGLVGLGVRPGDRVALLFPEADWIDYAVGVLGIYLSGGAVVGLSPRLAADGIERRLRHCGVSGLLYGAGIAAPSVAGWARGLRDVARSTGAVEPEVRPEDLVEIIYTSGTTGPAKPVAVTHANLTFGRDAGALSPAGPGALTPVPPGTNAGHSAILVALTGGSTVHVLTDQSASRVAQALEELPVGAAILPAPLAVRLAATRLLEGRDLSGLRAVMLGSTPVYGAVADYLRKLLPDAALSVGYGSTEAAPASAHHPIPPAGPLGAPGVLGRMGRGSAAEVRDRDGVALPPGEVGEIWLRSPAPPRGYFKAVDDGTFRDGWTRMGDRGSIDRDGVLSFFSRSADALAVDGEPVSAFRVEDALLWHPDVADAAVVQLPDGRLAAAVEVKDPAGPPDLRAHLAGRVARHEVPDLIVPVGSLPRGGLGKVLKRRLRESLTSKGV